MVDLKKFGRATVATVLASGLLGSVPGASAAPSIAQGQTTDAQTYIVLYNQSAVPADAATSVATAGGQLVASYDAIGVAIATSTNTNFRNNVRQDARVQDAGASAKGVTRLRDRGEDNDISQGRASTTQLARPATDTDSLSNLQWDMRQIHTPEAHRITLGNRSVLVGDIDTGLDYQHPDLKANIALDASASCISGQPETAPSAWNDNNGHGTHTAGTIAAADNGIGIVGVAPRTRIAAIKAGDANGFFFPHAVVCAFMWAGTHHINVTNNSYFADPFYYNCPSDPEQKAILQAEARAIRFAQNRGVAVIAAEGNFSDDLANPTQDVQSPDNGTPITRPVDRTCLIVPTEIPGVIVVSADGNLRQKAYYSNYGLGLTQVTAPGGDRRFQKTADAPTGRVLSTWPASLASACGVGPDGLNLQVSIATSDKDEPIAYYCYLQGTSMASPHVAGVAALILSRYGNQRGADDEDGNPTSRLQRLINRSADPVACPTDPAVLAHYIGFPSVNNGAPQKCTGTLQYNSWYGHGEVNALKAVSGERDD